jgi:hypothetical protein
LDEIVEGITTRNHVANYIWKHRDYINAEIHDRPNNLRTVVAVVLASSFASSTKIEIKIKIKIKKQ